MLVKPFERVHNDKGIEELSKKIEKYPKKEVKILMEATSHCNNKSEIKEK